MIYQDGATERQMQVPKGDVFHQFRDDVRNDRLPAVSWIVAPENFSDHPDSPWYGAWYIAEALDILTQNPAVWKKTIFILCYDENDGYFDHVPPFVAPHPDRPESGRASAGIDTSVEHVRAGAGGGASPEISRRTTLTPGRSGWAIACRWSSPRRGAAAGMSVRRCSTTPRSCSSSKIPQPQDRPENPRDEHQCLAANGVRRPDVGVPAARRRQTMRCRPGRADAISSARSIRRSSGSPRTRFDEADARMRSPLAREAPRTSPRLPRQEPGSRPSCALPYELEVHGSLAADRRLFVIQFGAGRELFGARAAGAPFYVYAPGRTRVTGSEPAVFESGRNWAYAVSAGDRLSDSWRLDDFEGGFYHLRVHGPNGFFREFRGGADDPGLEIAANAPRGSTPAPGELILHLVNRDGTRPLTVIVDDLSYGNPMQSVTVGPADSEAPAVRLAVPVAASFGWYDVRLRVREAPQFEQRFAGRVETGQEGVCDPLIG